MDNDYEPHTYDNTKLVEDEGTLNTRMFRVTGGPQYSVTRYYRLATVCLGLLCVLLLAAVIGLCVKKHQVQTSNNELTIGRDQLQTSYSKLTVQMNQLQTTYNKLTIERDQLQTSYKNMTDQRDQLQVSYHSMAVNMSMLEKERDELRRECPVLAKYMKEGWKYLNSSAYSLFTGLKTWNESRQDCIERGADLVVINSKEEQDFVGMLIRSKDMTAAWIGLTDHVTDGVWKWVDGTALSTGYWRRGEPSQFGLIKEDCASIRSDSQPYRNWNDMACSEVSYWICEKKIVY